MSPPVPRSVLASQAPQGLLFPLCLVTWLFLGETILNPLPLHLHTLVRISPSCFVFPASFAPLLQLDFQQDRDREEREEGGEGGEEGKEGGYGAREKKRQRE